MLDKHPDVWLRTVATIARAGVVPVAAEPRQDRRSRAAASPLWDGKVLPTVRVLDRPTSRTLTVSWCDPLTCHYGYQTWRVHTAKRAGTCVLSGRAIKAGDIVYCPRASNPPPRNAGAMIVAACVDL